MKIGFFTDTYFPQVSGVATSIYTLKNELEKMGHIVYIFTTTDPHANKNEEKRIIRLPSVPFISCKDRRVMVRGIVETYRIACKLDLDIIHTHTEFGLGILGKITAQRLKIPVVHTWHTNYEEYLHYIAKGKLIRPVHVKMMAKLLFNKIDGIVCPSQLVLEMLRDYGIKSPMRVISTGIDIHRFICPEITTEDEQNLRQSLGIQDSDILLLTLSRLAYEKNIHLLISGMPKIFAKYSNAHLVIVGDGPARIDLERQAYTLELSDHVHFTGMIDNKKVVYYYHAADYFISASNSETQGLTYAESLASGLQSIVYGNAYLEELLDNEMFGCLYYEQDAFANVLMDYMEKNIVIDEDLLNKKLYDISSDHFGLSMVDFYLDTLVHYSRKRIARQKKLALVDIKKKLLNLKKISRHKSKISS
ncbi:MAG: glycosyltransferase family 4 protein [Streptococcaceae bacterium]|jgi:1,2-diacylglycerol 3-alpha-glucosyltransferase|nr:glycosyltransferase family 4 protein [Streptococcaceae bacterium]